MSNQNCSSRVRKAKRKDDAIDGTECRRDNQTGFFVFQFRAVINSDRIGTEDGARSGFRQRN